jgi:hypothetical protein
MNQVNTSNDVVPYLYYDSDVKNKMGFSPGAILLDNYKPL